MTTKTKLPTSKQGRARTVLLAWASLACAIGAGAAFACAAPPDDAGTAAPPDSLAASAPDSTSVRAAAPDSVPAAPPDSAQAVVPDSTQAAPPDSVRATLPDSAQTAPPDSVQAVAPDSTSGFLSVRSIPSGRSVLVDSLAAGPTPIDSLHLAPGSYLVRVLDPDPRRFDSAINAVQITLHRGASVSVLIDVRPSVLLRSVPEPASVFLTARPSEAPDSLLGETPFRVRPSVIEPVGLRFTRPGYADTTLSGAAFVGDSAAVSSVRLRSAPSLALPPASAAAGAPIYRKAWFQWTLIGIGAVLSGAAVAFHHQGDLAYESYLASSDVTEIPGLYDDAVRYDRWAAVSLGVGQACFVSGFVLMVTGQR